MTTMVENQTTEISLSDVPVTARCRQTNDFTRALTELSLCYGVEIVGGRLKLLNVNWDGPDAEKWEQYAINEDNFLVRGFWNQLVTAVSR